MAKFALEGPKWGSSSSYGTTGGKVTWSFATSNYAGQEYDFDKSIGGSSDQAVIRAAFAKWESVCNIDFVEVSDASTVGIRLGLDAIDGPYNTVGECSFSYSGGRITNSEIRFDTAESFTSDYLYEVALHEIGHAIGFAHYDEAVSIMNAVSDDAADLTAGDIQGAVYVYGADAATFTIYPGGPGDDTYRISDARDVVNEAIGQGNDTVSTSVSYTLKAEAEIEALVASSVSSTTPINLTGNEFAQALRGNDGVNVLKGMAGNDTLIGNGGNDTLDGGVGTDSMTGGLGNDTYVVDNANDIVTEMTNEGTDTVFAEISHSLARNVENLTLANTAVNGIGNALANTILGNAAANLLIGAEGNDLLDGKAGVDTLKGGIGDDIYVVDNARDVVTEQENEGTDTVYAEISHALARNVENLTLANTAVNGLGNARDNVINGNESANLLKGAEGADTIFGGNGDDTLVGGTGQDILTGGAGSDLFVFDAVLNAASNVDRITDFNVAADTITLANGIFTALTATGTLAAGAFMANSTGLATQADDRIVYETDTGKLFYDSNGSAAGGAVQFAQLSANLALTHNDFLVV